MDNLYTRKQVIDYGLSHGYSDDKINKVIQDSKLDIIKSGLDSGLKGTEINSKLHNYGYGDYNPFTTLENYKRIPGNLANNAKQFAESVRTISGAAVQPLLDVQRAPKGERLSRFEERFNKAVNNDRFRKTFQGMAAGAAIGSAIPKLPYIGAIGPIGGGIVGGLIGLLGPREFIDTQLSTYDTSLGDIKKKGLGVLPDVAQGAFYNPLYAGLDVGSLGGVNAIKKVGGAIGNAIPSNAPVSLQQILPSKELREFNRNATGLINKARANNAEVMSPIERLNSSLTANREEITKYILTGEGKLSNQDKLLADDILKSISGSQDKLNKYGILDIATSKNNTVAQYVMQKMRDRIPNILHDDIYTYLTKNELTPRLAKPLIEDPVLRSELNIAIKEGEDLFNKNKIGFITQALTKSKDPLGEIIASDIAKEGHGYFGTKRIIGRSTPKEIGNVLDESLRFQMNEISKATEAQEVINDVLKDSKVGTLIDDITKDLPEGKMAFSPNAFSKELSRQINEGKPFDIQDALKKANVKEAGSYMINKVYGKALENMFKQGPRGAGRRLLSAFKKAVLAQPHWIVLNRIGNWSNNSMGGVTLLDYADAWKYKNLLPKQLAQQTSFNSYLGVTPSGVRTSSIGETLTKPLNNIGRGFKNFASSDKSLEEIGKLAGNTYANVSDIFSNPWFLMESKMEMYDRFSNMIHQAKKVGGKKWKDVLKKADNDQSLFNKLNTEVNKDLGDYVGRNYAIPGGVYNTVSELVPFYRFLTQTGRTSLHQMANNPLAFQSTIMAPGRAGIDLTDIVRNKYDLNPQYYQGGVPYRQDEDGNIRFVGLEPLPLHTVAESFASPENAVSIVSPYASMLYNTLRYRKSNDTIPTSRKLNELRAMNNPEAKNYRGTPGEIARFGLDQFLGSTMSPYYLSKTFFPEVISTIANNKLLRKYDASLNPLDFNPVSTPRETDSEKIGRWFGIQTRVGYKNKKQRRSNKPTKYSRMVDKKMKEYDRKKGNK